MKELGLKPAGRFESPKAGAAFSFVVICFLGRTKYAMAAADAIVAAMMVGDVDSDTIVE